MTATNQPKITSDAGQRVYSSLWDGLNPHLIARLHKLQHTSSGEWVQDPSSPMFEAVLTEANMEIALNWQSPFENTGTESQAPTVAAMLQTGALQPMIAAITDSGERFVQLNRMATDTLNKFQGRTGITKLNSTQVFNGMQPVKISATMVLRAWRDALQEVQTPLDLLMSWILPQELSKDGLTIARGLQQANGGNNGWIDVMMPSLAPTPVSMRYKRWRFENMVIESATIPIDSPITHDGYFVEMRVPFTLCSLTAIDRDDWKHLTSL